MQSNTTKAELVYLACPYSHKDKSIEEARFQAVNKVAAKLMAEGKFIFSPISHSHPIALAGKLPGDWKFWEGYDRRVLASCDRIIVLCLEGWRTSTGVQAEIKIGDEFGIPIEYLAP